MFISDIGLQFYFLCFLCLVLVSEWWWPPRMSLEVFLPLQFYKRVFIINWCWILSKAFSASIEIIIWVLSINLSMWYITLIDLHILKNTCIPGINLTWSWCMSFLMCSWILFASILLKIFFVCVHQWYWPLVFFYCVVFVWVWYQDDGGLGGWVWKCSFLCNFLKEF